MKTHILEVVNSSKLKTLSIKVTEEIDKKYLFDFLHTNIVNSDLITSKNSEFYYKFIKPNMSYEVILFDKSEYLTKQFVLEPFLLLAYYEQNSLDVDSIDLFYLDDYFVVYQNKELLLFKQINDVSLDDIVLYLLQTYKLTINRKIKIDNILIENCKNSYIKNRKIRKHHHLQLLFVDKSFKIFQMFIFVITIVFAYLLYNNLNGKQIISKSSKELISLENRYNNLLKIYQNNSKKPITNMIEFFKYIKINNIVVDTIKYKNKKLETLLVHKDKQILIDTVTMYGKNITINYIKYDKKSDTYKMEITIEF